MKKLSFILSVLIISAPCVSAHSNMGTYDAGLLNSQYMQELKMFERKSKEERELKQKSAPNQTSYLNKINFENNEAFSSEELESLFTAKIGTKIETTDIAEMKKTLTKFYQEQGYTSVIVLISFKKGEPESLTFSIQEGPKNSVSFE